MAMPWQLVYSHGHPDGASYWKEESDGVTGSFCRSVSCVGKKSDSWTWRMSGNRSDGDVWTKSENET